jgi:sensor domain CHASE-containing protein
MNNLNVNLYMQIKNVRMSNQQSFEIPSLNQPHVSKKFNPIELCGARKFFVKVQHQSIKTRLQLLFSLDLEHLILISLMRHCYIMVLLEYHVKRGF